jgi:ketosteroid isomerase-like protein
MMPPEAEAFAEHWIAAWNAHDLDRILAHYAPDIEFLSPVAREVTGDGRVVGITALRAYWTRAMALNPELTFERVAVFTGDRCITVVYRNHRRQLAAETFEFEDSGRVVRAFACYRMEP